MTDDNDQRQKTNVRLVFIILHSLLTTHCSLLTKIPRHISNFNLMRIHFMILKNLILLLLTLVFGHLTLVSFAQGDLHFTKHYTQKDGLTNTAVSLIYEDSRGFLWMGTKEGLNRFDGLHFKTFFHNKNSANSLPHNAVLDFLEYQPGLLLIATPNGLTVFNSLIGKFEQERIGHVPFTKNFSSQYISLFQDKE